MRELMKKQWITAAMVLLALPMLVGAQERPRRPARVEVGPRAFAFTLNRGRIGVVVQTDENAESDRFGARIEAISPGGPAEKAGLKADDIITRFNGVSLAKSGAEDSNPGAKLIRLAQALDPGDTVRVEYRRGTESRSATLVAEDVDVSWSLGLVTPRPGRDFMIDPDFRLHLPEGDHGFSYWFGSGWGSLELVSLNADLGEYFGTQEGLLVIRAPDGDGPSLKSGDVILAIDGRKPTSPAHAMRILRSYDGGESVKIDVMRKQRRLTVSWTVPDREEPTRRSRRRSSESETT
jgi:S1-C subfamily serine protease